jgi:hypothetical protein
MKIDPLNTRHPSAQLFIGQAAANEMPSFLHLYIKH